MLTKLLFQRYFKIKLILKFVEKLIEIKIKIISQILYYNNNNNTHICYKPMFIVQWTK